MGEGIHNFAWVAAFILLIIGLTLMTVLLYLHRQSHRLKSVLMGLYQLNEAVHQDVLQFIDQAWPFLSQAKFTGLNGHVDWFGEQIPIRHGLAVSPSQQAYPLKLVQQGIEVHLSAHMGRLRGEDQLMAQLVWQQFSALLSLDVNYKISQFLLSQKRLERYQLFVQHDIKNIAQFITLLADQLEQAQTDGEKLATYHQLQSIMPTISRRATQTIQQMTQPSRDKQTKKLIDVRPTLEKIAKSYDVSIHISGQAKLWGYQWAFEQVFQRLFENFQHHAPQAVVDVVISDNHQIQLSAPADAQESISAARMFEPFWTTSESGMGLGLYLARETLKTMGGELHFDHQHQQNTFVVQFAQDNHDE